MKILIDMNLSPQWVEEFKINNIYAFHWSSVGRFDAADIELMDGRVKTIISYSLMI